MKRSCSEEEKQLLYKNREQMLKGIFHTASESRSAPAIISVILAVVLAVGLRNVLGVTDFIMKLFAIALFFMLRIIVRKIMNAIRENLQIRKYTKRKNIMINGGTIVSVEEADRFSYVEDDVISERDRPIVIDYPSRAYDIMPEDIGKRIIILYSSENDYQVVKLNDELRGMIPDDVPIPDKVLERGLRLPHPGILNIDRIGHSLSDEEKESFAKRYARMVQRTSLNKGKIYSIVIIICMVILGVAISSVEGYSMWKILQFELPVWMGMAVIYWFFTLIRMPLVKRKARFISVKEVIFHSYVIENKTATIKVYESNNWNVSLREYPAGKISEKTSYGSTLYQLTHRTDGIVFMSKEATRKMVK